MTRVLVTGASGHIGNNLVRALLKHSKTVRCLVRQQAHSLNGLDVDIFYGDVRDRDAIKPAFQGIDTVYHLAALIAMHGEPENLVNDINVKGTRNVARLALAAGVQHFVHVSSIRAFRTCLASQDLEKKQPKLTDKASCYDRSKSVGDTVIQNFIEQGLPAPVD